VLDFVLSHTLRLFHPFLPFITEELWHGMGYHEEMPATQGGESIMHAPWPKPLDDDFKGHYGLDDCYIEIVDAKYDLVTKGRNLRREAGIPANKKVKFVFKATGVTPQNDVKVLELLLNAESLVLDSDYQPPKGTPAVHSELGELYLPLEGLIDPAAEKARLTKELAKTASDLALLEQKLNNPAFTAKARPEILLDHQKRLADAQARQAHLQRAMESLG
jgi:valyl-tRNA synthetase